MSTFSEAVEKPNTLKGILNWPIYRQFIQKGTQDNQSRKTAQNPNYLQHVLYSLKTPLFQPRSSITVPFLQDKIETLYILTKHLHKIILEPEQTFSFSQTIHQLPNFYKLDTKFNDSLYEIAKLISLVTNRTTLTITNQKLSQSGLNCDYELEIKNQTNQIFELGLELLPSSIRATWHSDEW